MTSPLQDCLTGLTGSSTRAGTGCTDLQFVGSSMTDCQTLTLPSHLILYINRACGALSSPGFTIRKARKNWSSMDPAFLPPCVTQLNGSSMVRALHYSACRSRHENWQKRGICGTLIFLAFKYSSIVNETNSHDRSIIITSYLYNDTIFMPAPSVIKIMHIS